MAFNFDKIRLVPGDTRPRRDDSATNLLDKIGVVTTRFFVDWICFLLVLLVGLVACNPGEFHWGLPAVAAGFVGIGLIGGFLYSLYGDDEKEAFKAIIATLATAFSAAGLADLTNPKGLLRPTYHEVALAAGLGGDREGWVIALGAIFVPLGFFALYFFRRLVLNRHQHREEAAEKTRAELAPAIEIDLDATAGAAVFRTSPGAGETATKWLARTVDSEPSYDDRLADARAQIVLGKYEEAAASLRQALRVRQDSPVATFLLAAAYVATKSYADAINILEELTQKDPGPTPLNAWKLLGYARLFHDSAKPDHGRVMRLSADATTKFLACVPCDLGAMLNRACAYGQIGPTDPEARERVIADLTQLFKINSAAKEDVRALTVAGEDFAAWKDVPAFKLITT